MESRTRDYLTRLADELRTAGDAATAALIDTTLTEYKARHWHEMTVALVKAVATSPLVLAQAYDLYDSVIATVRLDISPIAYVTLVQAVCFSPASTLARAMEVVEGAQACFVGQDATQGRYAAQCIRAMLLLQSGDNNGNGNGNKTAVVSSSSSTAGGVWSRSQDHEATALSSVPGTGPHTARKILEEVETYIQSLQMHEMEPALLAMLCRARGRDYEIRGQFSRYYINAFDTVAHADKAEMVIPAAEMAELAFTTAVAALLSEEIFNFGKYLNFTPFVSALESSGVHAWVLTWMRMCNEGKVAEFEAFFHANSATAIKSQAQILCAHGDRLGSKVRLMALLHLVFYTPFDKRTFPFSTVASRCCVAESRTEPLLLAALAQGIVKGKIDGLDRFVHIAWVEPRVLSVNEVKELAQHVAQWREKVVGVTSFVSKQTETMAK